MPALPDIIFIGFGEAATAFAKGWRGANLTPSIKAYDVKTDDAALKDAKLADYKAQNVEGCVEAKAAITGATIIFSMVTADQAAEAAANTAQYIEQGQYYFDCNSCAPETKKTNAKLINAAGGRYVDVAVMAPVYPKMHQVPLLICGEYAQQAQDFFDKLDMKAEIVDGEIGQASSIKMVRSIMIKGLEALNAECLLAARKLGIDETILTSLEKSFPEFGWHKRSGYMLERMMQHGVRRAAEMREVALTVAQLGLNNSMAKATVEWQQLIGNMKLQAVGEEFETLSDQILDNMGDEK
ncbi:MAG: NAD(P)-dependent oxidoreductase [OCS116 cluster bacterium]|uniref:3-hydroxyisobutyrate dehydrogenase n=1 Tax=OCS116 cluster bacterium TaxID=2030921 RepID=A0A2A4Z8P4_9PROT|nr:NAD(P)-dependent oxidoreductase [OCS116 cluster bacterium]